MKGPRQSRGPERFTPSSSREYLVEAVIESIRSSLRYLREDILENLLVVLFHAVDEVAVAADEIATDDEAVSAVFESIVRRRDALLIVLRRARKSNTGRVDCEIIAVAFTDMYGFLWATNDIPDLCSEEHLNILQDLSDWR